MNRLASFLDCSSQLYHIFKGTASCLQLEYRMELPASFIHNGLQALGSRVQIFAKVQTQTYNDVCIALAHNYHSSTVCKIIIIIICPSANLSANPVSLYSYNDVIHCACAQLITKLCVQPLTPLIQSNRQRSRKSIKPIQIYLHRKCHILSNFVQPANLGTVS